ncbi:hypothetical protein ACFV1C_00195 [Streptomyces sp. NPDC059605]|uniref:hypothetical protein n=1 Tax=Streptomyces sp. NPDC059605 TaxID=3346882 RepID=UPI003679894B
MSLREEVVAPLRGLHPRAVIIGSGVLIRLLARALVQAVRAVRALYRRLRPAEQEEEAPEKAEGKKEPTAAKKPTLVKVAGKVRRKPSGKGKSKEPDEETSEGKAEGAEPSTADRLEKAAVTGLGILVLLAVLGTAIPPLVEAAVLPLVETLAQAVTSFVSRFIAPYVHAALSVLAVAWIITAAVLASPSSTTKHDHEPVKNDDVGEWPAEEPDQKEPDPKLMEHQQFVRQIVRAVHESVQQGRKGALLPTIAETMPEEMDAATLRAECKRWDVPTRKMQIRGMGVGSTWGVRADELETALGVPLADALDGLERPPNGHPFRAPREAAEGAPAGAGEQPPAGPPTPLAEALAQALAGAPVEGAQQAAPQPPLAHLIRA